MAVSKSYYLYCHQINLMKKLHQMEKIGIALILICIVMLLLNVFEIETRISQYGSYVAAMGAVFWYRGYKNRKEQQKKIN